MTIADDFAKRATELVKLDIQNGFDRMLEPLDEDPIFVGLHDSDLESDEAVATAGVLVAMPWRFRCTHVGPFLNIEATGIEIELHGTTFVDVRGAESSWTYYRYIDFMGALQQLGVSTDGRPVLPPTDDG